MNSSLGLRLPVLRCHRWLGLLLNAVLAGYGKTCELLWFATLAESLTASIDRLGPHVQKGRHP